MELTISYLAAARLGELEGLAANEISPMRDLGPVIAGMRESFGPEGAEKLDELLALQGLTVSDGGIGAAGRGQSAVRRGAEGLFDRAGRQRMRRADHGRAERRFVRWGG